MNDKVKITLVSGKGGDGAIAFRHEKCIENGGPYGGNGGKGGSISFVADNGIDTLSQYRFGKTFKAEEGGNGRSKLMARTEKTSFSMFLAERLSKMKMVIGLLIY